MTQFTKTTLARLLLNVDRAILREAVAEADLWDVFSSFERQAMDELGQMQNSRANLALFGTNLIETERAKFKAGMETIRAEGGFFTKMYVDFLNGIFGILDTVDEAKNSLEQTISEIPVPVFPPDIDPRLISEVIRELNRAVFILKQLLRTARLDRSAATEVRLAIDVVVQARARLVPI